MTHPHRRDFLRTTLAASAIALSADSPAPAAGTAPWPERPMRWAQLTLVENDPGQYDLHFWLDYFRRTHSDAACLSAGGCVAFYPTKIPLHYRSQWMAGHRSVRRPRLRLPQTQYGRPCPHRSARRHQDVYDAHPDWIAVDAEGKKRAPLGHARTGGSPARSAPTTSIS